MVQIESELRMPIARSRRGFLASSAWSLVPGNRPALVPVADSRPVGELVHGDALVVAADLSVRQAVVQMTEHHVSYALIRLPDGELGIFTDRDLRTRVVAAGLNPIDVKTRSGSGAAAGVAGFPAVLGHPLCAFGSRSDWAPQRPALAFGAVNNPGTRGAGSERRARDGQASGTAARVTRASAARAPSSASGG